MENAKSCLEGDGLLTYHSRMKTEYFHDEEVSVSVHASLSLCCERDYTKKLKEDVME